jgi:hypothetical protein
VRVVRESGLPNRIDAMFTNISCLTHLLALNSTAAAKDTYRRSPRHDRRVLGLSVRYRTRRRLRGNAAFAAMALFGHRLGFAGDQVGGE